ncbi:MAG: sel1 repeat family protein [Hyperionvirus sp.]|uniref:Sel1 repeat family protein n=1 Tax=Hyperionvirus sp. TaxID=2487770 RepID=A0A3G5ACY1_9VIRU|nr:MAG: sel1 repeat family protein [Hyperionvirus sp.]
MGLGVSYLKQDTLDLPALERDLSHGKIGYHTAFKICDRHIKKYGCPKAAYLKGKLHAGFVYGKVNYNKTRKLFEMAADKNYIPAIRDLAVMYFTGKREWLKAREPVAITDNEQLGLFHMSVQSQLADCTNAAEGRDFKRSFQLLTDGIRIDGSDGQMLLYIGEHYEYGYGTEVDYKMALERYNDAHKMGEQKALDYICGMYIGGKGCDLRSEEALMAFKMAESGNKNFSKINMALLYEARGDVGLAYKYCSEYVGETHDNHYQKLFVELANKKDTVAPKEHVASV